MKKKILLFAVGIVVLTLTFSGCATAGEQMDKTIDKRLKVSLQSSDTDYQKYQELQDSGKLGENGEYIFEEADSTAAIEIPEGKFLITFVNNSFLDCSYHCNDEDNLPKDCKYCCLGVGESLYASAAISANEISNLYAFDKYRIWSYDAEGKRSKTPFNEVESNEGLLLTIPEGYDGTGFSVEPLGVYNKRDISVKAYYIDKDEKQQELSGGEWTVNDKKFVSSTSIDPVNTYTIKYDYSSYANDYYFASSNPQCWYVKESENIVIFPEISSADNQSEFSVQMHTFITLSVNNNCYSTINRVIDFLPLPQNMKDGLSNPKDSIITSITKNGDSVSADCNGKTFSLSKLKFGDTITIRVKKDYMLCGIGINIGTPNPLGSDAENGYEYTLKIPDASKNIEIDITERNSNHDGRFSGYNLENATLKLLRSNGTEIRPGDELPADSEKVTLEIEPFNGYYLDGKGVENFRKYSKKMKFSDFEKNASTIIAEHPATKYVSIQLAENDETGFCTYELDGKSVSTSVLARVGQKLKISYTANDDYRIVRDVWIAEKMSNLFSKNSINGEIVITAEMNCTTIARSDFGILVEKAG